MCILLLVFEEGLGTDTRTIPYPLCFARRPRHSPNYSRFIRTSPSGRFRTLAPGRCLVPTPSIGMKLIYCNSIKQRERSYFRQLIVRVWDLRATYSMLDMLTYHFTSLSNPGQPHGCCCKDNVKDLIVAIGCQLLASSLIIVLKEACCYKRIAFSSLIVCNGFGELNT